MSEAKKGRQTATQAENARRWMEISVDSKIRDGLNVMHPIHRQFASASFVPFLRDELVLSALTETPADAQ